ncbi:MAG: hypothetical protein ACYC46_13840 [Acidobacteriaceae bacterium]
MFNPFASSQVFVVGAESATGKLPAFHPTEVPLQAERLTPQTRQQLIRLLTAEQGFASRPIPRGSKGVTLQANGALSPDHSDYAKTLYEKGVSSAAGDRVAITNIKIKGNKIIFDLNGGPDPKHKWLRHLQVGMDPNYTMPVVQDDPYQQPTGSRITLAFKDYVPEMTGKQVQELLAPLIDFSLKSPIQAYTDTLPPKLRDAILAHHVLVGMNHRMVIAAMGQPEQKIREHHGDMSYEEWLYGQPPDPVQFVRFIGDRVVRMEVAAVGKDPVIRDHDETDGYFAAVQTREVAYGDASPNQAGQQTLNPTLRNPGDPRTPGSELPVNFPKEKNDPTDAGATASPDQQSPPPSLAPSAPRQ